MMFWLIIDPEQPGAVQVDVALRDRPEDNLIGYAMAHLEDGARFVKRWRRDNEPDGVPFHEYLAAAKGWQVGLVDVGYVHRANDMPLGNAMEIVQFLHCGLCLEELKRVVRRKGSASPRDYARLSMGWTKRGFQVWCNRHDVNVCHVDFQSHRHPANTTRALLKKEIN